MVATLAAIVLTRFGDVGVSVAALLAGGFATFVLSSLGRSRYANWLRRQRRQGRCCRRVVILGDGQAAVSLIDRATRAAPELGYLAVAQVGERPVSDIPFIGLAGDPDRLVEAMQCAGATGAIVTANFAARVDLNGAVRAMLDAGMHVHVDTGITGVDHRRIGVQPVGYDPFIYVAPNGWSREQSIAKRALDIGGAVVGLVLVVPVGVAIALAIKMNDRGPVFFRQERVGRHGQPFKIIKFRTMCEDAESRLEELRKRNERTGPLFKVADDPRVTRLGRFLRRSSLDELPQLWNVLTGSMSLVGPRPALADEAAAFPHRSIRDQVRPGISGLWQVEGRDDPSFDLYERLDVYYVENWSVMLDVAILLRTGRAVFQRLRREQHPEMHVLVGS